MAGSSRAATYVVCVLFVIVVVGIAYTYRDVRQFDPLHLRQTTPLVDLQIMAKSDRMQAVYVRAGNLYAIEERSVYISRDQGNTFEVLGYLPRPSSGFKALLKKWVAKNSYVRRLRKSPGPASLVVLNSGTVIVVSDQIYRKAPTDTDFSIVPSVGEFLPPFESGRTLGLGPDDTLYFGEYTKGPHPKKMRIFRGSNDGLSWGVAYQFPAGQIYHVHSIEWDQYRQRFWVSTGDADSESHIFYTADNFRTLELLGGGSQDWRAVSLLVQESRLVWGSDDGRNNSFVFEWDFTQKRLNGLAKIGNPASYIGALADGTLLVSTTYIPLTEYGKTGDAEPEAALWASRNGQKWQKVYTLPAAADLSGDKRPQFRLPGGDASLPHAYVTPLYTREHDFSVLKLGLVWK
ncbi:hypothetical protein [Teredinibacter franksiae]|uniref:hypothetical protein n=1 Tax=Teredinibacter franksiae TaxID=2761453 RepID=UPI0016290EF6|nr:hypothetical protein [Teredinibacter franksiae]